MSNQGIWVFNGLYLLNRVCYHMNLWNNEQIWLPGNYGSDFEQYLNRFQLDPISLLVNFSNKLAQIMTTYDFLSAKQAVLSNVRTDFNLTQFCFWSTFNMNWLRWISCKVAQIMTTYEFLRSGEVILSTVRNIANFTYLEWLQLYLPGMAKLSYFDAYNGAIWPATSEKAVWLRHGRT